jgi:hypothetical protein
MPMPIHALTICPNTYSSCIISTYPSLSLQLVLACNARCCVCVCQFWFADAFPVRVLLQVHLAPRHAQTASPHPQASQALLGPPLMTLTQPQTPQNPQP